MAGDSDPYRARDRALCLFVVVLVCVIVEAQPEYMSSHDPTQVMSREEKTQLR